MIRKFVNRIEELKFLESEFNRPKSSFIVLYGRRRIGKSELLKKFIKEHPHVYFLTSQEPSHLQRDRLIKQIAQFLKERIPKIDDWLDAIDYIGEKLRKKRFILVIDEFPYLINSNKSIPSFFQRLNDEHLKDSNSMLILSGSSIAMMESEVLGHKSPLYGRRTGQIDLQPFDFKTIRLMIKKELEDRIILNAIFGNIPMYLSFYDETLSIKDNILNNVLDKSSFLHKEPEFILKQELREPSNYMAILMTIAHGKTKLKEISDTTGIQQGVLSKYIGQLIKLRLIVRETPITETNKQTKKSLYFISDGLFRFYFRFVEPNPSNIEDNPKKFLEYNIMPDLTDFVAKTFENVCTEFVKKNLNFGLVGRWWHKEQEIDIIGLNKKDNKILFCECKWQNNVDGTKILQKLKQKSQVVRWGTNKRKEQFAIFAKSFSKTNNEAKFYTLKELKRYFG